MNLHIIRQHDGAVYQTTICKAVDPLDVISMQKEHRLLILKLRRNKLTAEDSERLQELETVLFDCLEDFEEVGGSGAFDNIPNNATILNF